MWIPMDLRTWYRCVRTVTCLRECRRINANQFEFKWFCALIQMHANHDVSARRWKNLCKSVEFASIRTNAHIRICVLLHNHVAFSHDVLCSVDFVNFASIRTNFRSPPIFLRFPAQLAWASQTTQSAQPANPTQPKYKRNQATTPSWFVITERWFVNLFRSAAIRPFRLLLYIQKYTGRKSIMFWKIWTPCILKSCILKLDPLL